MLALALAAAVLAVTAALGAASLRLRSRVSFLLALYVLASAEVVALTEVLSLGDAVGRTGYLVGEGVLLAVAAAAWLTRGLPLPALPRLDRIALRRHPLVAALAALVTASLLFQAFLVVSSPPNNNDSLTYHLSRAAEWYQRGAVERFPSYQEIHNAYPPNAGMEILYGFSFLGRDTLAAAPQLLARLALLAAVFGLARRAGFPRAAAAFATLVFSCLTLVVVQAVTTQNDLVVAALVAAAAFLALESVGRDARAAPLAGLALGLAVGTKWTGAAAVPILALLAVAASRNRRALARLALWSVAGAVAVGSYGYALNLADTGNPLGEVEALGGVETDPSVSAAASTAYRIVLDFADFSSYHRNANEDTSFFGTLGWALMLPLSAGFTLAWARRSTLPVRGALALALPYAVVFLALAHPYDRFTGRLLIAPVALTAALAAWVYGRRWVTPFVGALAATTLVLAVVFNEAKPVGVRGAAVWTLSRTEAQTLKDPPLGEVVAALDARVPADGRLGAVLRKSAWSYPLYGRTLGRRVTYLEPGGALAAARRLGLRWVVFSDGVPVERSAPGWRFTEFARGWTLAERS